ncbi:MAG TPA: UDP-2,3-diacylglucosamine diphosphatase [Bacteroidaceae bacterium]|nr:UDP-2,3-diacylglucosamine diphosphatase [Bacteroidaceae bacterium]
MTEPRKHVYFLSDAHLGCLAIEHRRTQERRLVHFLDSIKNKARAIYLLGDIFDFWYEYKMVVPKGYTRFFGKIAEMTDMGIEVHFFPGNHDWWCGDYFEKECGMTLHYGAQVLDIMGQEFYLAHGDGLGETDKKFVFLRKLFHSSFLRSCFNCLHPRWAIDFGLQWAKKSRLNHQYEDGSLSGEPYKGEKNEFLIIFAKDYLKAHPTINFFMFGHRHFMLDLMLTRSSRVLVLGDWITHYSYAVWDGEHMMLDQYLEGETQP